MKREFYDGFTKLKNEEREKPIEFGEENISFLTCNMLNSNNVKAIGTTEKDLKENPDQKYFFSDANIIPDGNGGYEVMSDDDISNLVNKYSQAALATKNINSKPDDMSILTDFTKENQTRAYETEDGTIVRIFKSLRPVIIAKKYMLVLKHVPESKFSARSIGTTNQVGIPNKPGKHNEGTAPFSENPVRFSEMEINNASLRVDPKKVHRLIATYGTNPPVREKLVEILLNEDPFQVHDIPIKDEDIIDDIPALMADSLLFCMGIDITQD
jgi:hypothetical protein